MIGPITLYSLEWGCPALSISRYCITVYATTRCPQSPKGTTTLKGSALNHSTRALRREVVVVRVQRGSVVEASILLWFSFFQILAHFAHASVRTFYLGH